MSSSEIERRRKSIKVTAAKARIEKIMASDAWKAPLRKLDTGENCGYYGFILRVDTPCGFLRKARVYAFIQPTGPYTGMQFSFSSPSELYRDDRYGLQMAARRLVRSADRQRPVYSVPEPTVFAIDHIIEAALCEAKRKKIGWMTCVQKEQVRKELRHVEI